MTPAPVLLRETAPAVRPHHQRLDFGAAAASDRGKDLSREGGVQRAVDEYVVDVSVPVSRRQLPVWVGMEVAVAV
jgi:hypothetical protein